MASNPGHTPGVRHLRPLPVTLPRTSSLSPPGLRPGSVNLERGRGDSIRVPLVLRGDVRCDLREVTLREGGGVITPSPTHRAGHSIVCEIRAHGLRQANEVAEPRIGTKTHQQMHVVGEDGALQNLDAGAAPRSGRRETHVLCRRLIHATNTLISVPRDVGIHLIRVVGRHGRACSYLYY